MINYSFKQIIERTRKTVFTGSGLMLIAFSLVAHAGKPATQYELELVDAPLPVHPDFPGTPWTDFTDINDRGIAVWQGATPDSDFSLNFLVNEYAGTYNVKKGEFITLWEGTFNISTGESITLSGTQAYGINNRGALVTTDCSYIDKHGVVVELTHPIHDDCVTRGINSKGVISGFTIDDPGTWRGFVYDPKTDSFEDFLPDPDRNIAQGINSRGEVAGSIGPFGDRDGYVRDKDGDIRIFKVNIDGVRYSTQARGITNGGIIVGTFSTDDANNNGFVGRLSKDPADQELIPDVVFTPDNTPECDWGVFLTRINNKGVISGICFADGGNIEKGLLLTPRGKSK